MPDMLRSGGAGRAPGVAEPVKRSGGASSAPSMLRRIYSRGWYANAPLARAGLYALGAAAPAAMGAAIFRAVTRAGVSGFRGHAREILAVTVGDPQPWSLVATLDGILAITFINMWIAFREGRALPRLAWIGTNYIGGMSTAGCVTSPAMPRLLRVDIVAPLRRRLYVLKALMEARGDWTRFWMGARAPGAAYKKEE